MFCRACSTRLEPGLGTCPNCGRVARTPLAEAPAPEPLRAASLARAQAPPPAELELYDELDLEQTHASPGAGRLGRASGGAPRAASRGAPLSGLAPAELRARVAQEPDLLEPGLSTLTDQQGNPIGAGYTTDVGAIDLLARDSNGDYVVVMIAERDPQRDPVAEILQRIGWVRKHLGGGAGDVRGIVLVEPPLRDLSYAAAAVAGTVSFKTWRVALTFQDVAL